MSINTWIYVSTLCFVVQAFIPHPAVRLGGQAGDSITHTDMVQLGFIRSLARYFIDIASKSGSSINVDSLKGDHTIDQLYQIMHPDWSKEEVTLYSYPLKSVIDRIQVRDALVDLREETKNLPSAHFDSESFVESNRRIMNLRKQVVEDAMNPNGDLNAARGRIGDLLHTLQDFYSHSNWIEMGRTEVNDRIGLQEDIGPIAGKDQATCSSHGCTKITTTCNLLQKLIFKNCPMEYYDCKDNILNEINQQGILTSGYMSNQFDENHQPIIKPSHVEKCSHGSVMDKTSHHPAIGGINKDSMTPVYSPHYHLHFNAANLSIAATERFFNDLRRDIGDANFDRLFAINPTQQQMEQAAADIAERKEFHFLTSTLSIGLSSGDVNFQKIVRERLQKIMNILFGAHDSNTPTYDLSDLGFDENDNNIHSGSLVLDQSKRMRKRTFFFK